MSSGVLRRKGGSEQNIPSIVNNVYSEESYKTSVSWKRILLLIIAITIHNIPGLFLKYVLCSVIHYCRLAKNMIYSKILLLWASIT